MKMTGLVIEPDGYAPRISGWPAVRRFQFRVRKGAEEAGLESLKHLLTSGYKVSLADHSRGDFEGGHSFTLDNGKLETHHGGHGWSSRISSINWVQFEELFKNLLPFNYGEHHSSHGYITERADRQPQNPPANPHRMTMKWWKKALLFSVIWIALTIGAGIIHTDVILAGKITPQQDEAISQKYGELAGLGLGIIWVVSAFLSRKGRNSGPKA